MAHLSGTFSHAKAGRLQITLTGTFEQGSRRDAGFPSGGSWSDANILIRAYVGPAGASRKYTEPIDRYAPATILEVDYPGGSVSWPVGTEEIAHINPTGGTGIWSYNMRDLRMTLVLRKK